MIIEVKNKQSIESQYFTEENILNIHQYVKDAPIVLAFDQSSTASGCTIALKNGQELLFMCFYREGTDGDYVDYKNLLKVALIRLLTGCNIFMILHEDTYSEGFIHVDEVLSAIKTLFKELKYEMNWTCDIIPVPQQTWKSCFLLEGNKQQTKENVAIAVAHYYPNLYAVQDIYDSVGIMHYYKTQILPSISSPIFKPYKGMKIEKTHNLSIRVQQVWGRHNLTFTEDEVKHMKKNGCAFFMYDNTKWIEDNCRYLTSSSNKVWIAEVDNTNRGNFVNAVWCNYDIIPEDGMKLYVICYRINKLKNAKLDKRLDK